MELGRHAKQGCWTCKARKIGCDRGYPACNNCLRTSRKCKGYDLRLAWPDQPDGRRRKSRVPDQEAALPPGNTKYYGRQFLNVTYAEMARVYGSSPELLSLVLPQPRPGRCIPLLPDLRERESHLITYYENVLSRMISTIDINNGFRDTVLPMALSSQGSASVGLRNALLAVAAFHLSGSKAALPYKMEAMGSLSSSISSKSIDVSEAQLATSMMLCVYNVFDETEGHWDIHLNGAKTILGHLASAHGNTAQFSFLYTWFLYHEILGEFSNPLRCGVEGPLSLQIQKHWNLDTSIIVGSLGCTVEVMENISFINRLRKTSPTSTAETWKTEWHRIETQLSNLSQRIDSVYAAELPNCEQTIILARAELYRIAAFLYLQRFCTSARANELRSIYLEEALRILRSLDVCTSPWPLFVVACETGTEQQKIEVLAALDKMLDVRQIGNIFVLRDMIQSYWNEQDLQADHIQQPNLKWWDAINLTIPTPWFI